MLYVNFVQGKHEKLPKHERIPFDEAVALSQEIEMEMREKKAKITSYFYVIDDELPDSLYEGEFVFGSYTAPNLFIHIRNNLPTIRTNKEHEKLRLSFIADMEEATDEQYKQEEDMENDLYRDLDSTKISHLKRWQRRTIYGAAGFFAILSAGVFAFFFLQIAGFQTAYEQQAAEAEEQSDVITYYEQALLGEEENLQSYLGEKNVSTLSNRETGIYARMMADQEEFETLNTLYEGDMSLVASFLAQESNTDTLRAYNDQFPTNEGQFELAFADENYEELLEMENVEINNRRSEMRTEAFIELGDLEGAREELENNTSSDLADRINRLEELNSQIAELDEQISNLDDDDDEDEIATLQEEREEAESELNDL
ncbi:hypothetical protein [Alkalicoccus luteus]|uniref:Uncharacterized protein n=1 Tax=Alkalicoccus luteus TaxID=1237094 RepID=A0A969TWA2_9BACI|nr:hypothetical protein [Alkalicoccus luteus]NJP38977.1 hypothetical protein [Alkalicoccus luteus]